MIPLRRTVRLTSIRPSGSANSSSFLPHPSSSSSSESWQGGFRRMTGETKMKDLLGGEGILWTGEMRTSCAFFLLQTSNLRSFYLLNKFCEFVWKIIELNLIKRFLNKRERNKNKSSLHVYIILRKIFDSTIFSKEKEDWKGEKKKISTHCFIDRSMPIARAAGKFKNSRLWSSGWRNGNRKAREIQVEEKKKKENDRSARNGSREGNFKIDLKIERILPAALGG